jgi:hypothetical protein
MESKRIVQCTLFGTHKGSSFAAAQYPEFGREGEKTVNPLIKSQFAAFLWTPLALC